MKSIISPWNFDRASIPNQEGFRLVVWTVDGREVKTVVIKESGLHRLTVPIATVTAWRKL